MSAPQPVELQFDFSTITGRRDTHPTLHVAGFNELVEYLRANVRAVPLTRRQYLKLSKTEQAEAKDSPAIILARFKQPDVRTDEEVDYTSGIGLDVDEEHVELAELKRLLAGHAAIIYESANSTPEFRHWRVLLPFAVRCTPSLHALAFEHWSRSIPGVGSASRNPGRLWYGLTQFKGSPKRIFEVLAGAPFDPRTLMVTPVSPQEAFRRHIKPPADLPAAEGARNAQLSRYAASVVKDCASEQQLAERLLEQNLSYTPPLPEKEVRDMARYKWKGRSKFGWVSVDAPGETPKDFFLDIDAMDKAEPVGPHWIIANWLPGGTVSLYSGDGGSGKSLVAYEIAIRIALGLPVFGKPTERQRVMFVSAEDDENILHWRMKKICRKLKHKVRDLKGWLFIRDATGDANVLFTDNKFEGPKWTERRAVLLDAMQDCGAQLLVLDNASDHYDANENERAKVRQFITGFNAVLSPEQAVLLLAHVDAVTAMNPHESKGYSGSTAWNNSVRSRWFQFRDKDSGKVVLKLMKSNYAKAGEFVGIEWNDASETFDIGDAERPATSLDAHAPLILKLLDEYIESGGTVSPAPSANNNAYAKLHGHPQFPKGAPKGQLFRLIEQLLLGKFLEVVEVRGRNGKSSRQLVLTDKGRAASRLDGRG